MAQCWEMYLDQVHNAIPLDPWASTVQLLDIFIDETPRSWFNWQHRSSKKIGRIGSLLTLGITDGFRWKQELVEPLAAGLRQLQQHHGHGGTAATSSWAEGMFCVERMPDMQTCLKTSSSASASVTAGSVQAQFDVLGAKYVNATVVGVKSHRALPDALMNLVHRRSLNEPALWRPDIFRPEFRWSFKRGQTIWVVTEIMYADKIRMEGDTKAGADGSVKILTQTKAGEVGVSTATSQERDGVWEVNATSTGKAFPFAFRAKKLEYDRLGILKLDNSTIRRSNSLSKTILKRSSFTKQMTEQLQRSASSKGTISR